MNIMSINQLKKWAKHSDSSLAIMVLKIYHRIRRIGSPTIPILHSLLYIIHCQLRAGIGFFLRVFYWTPLFNSQLSSPARGLYLYGGLPCLLGRLNIMIGDNCRLAAKTTISGRSASHRTPLLKIGNNVGIGWRTTIAVGSKIIIGDNVRISADSYLAGYPGHPINAKERAQGNADTEQQAAPIILENDVWLATGVFVNAGVTIGEGTIVAAGSIVTKSLPANVLAGGNPAKIIKPL